MIDSGPIYIRIHRGEFGLKLRYHVPWIHALPGRKIVEIEEGEEALYPSAEKHVILPRGSDDVRRGPVRSFGEEEFFTPAPHDPPELEIFPDIVICPRWRRYGASKNWDRWPDLGEAFRARGFQVYAAGAPDSSDPRVKVDGRAWDHLRFLDASIEAMLRCRLVIATTSGLALLAILCGVPLLLITHEGLVAPGPQVDQKGRVMQSRYEEVRFLRARYMDPMNHQAVRIQEVDGWMNLDEIVNAAYPMLLS